MKINRDVAALIVAGIFCGSSYVYAEPALIETFDADGNCINQDGDIESTEITRQVVISNDGDGTVNVTARGTCTNTSGTAVNFDSDTFIGACNAGSAGLVLFWKYTMRPDGQYMLKCSSYPLED